MFKGRNWVGKNQSVEVIWSVGWGWGPGASLLRSVGEAQSLQRSLGLCPDLL